MRLNEIILSLVSGIDDPAMRIDVASTIRYLYDVYRSRPEVEDEIRRSLYEIALTIVNYKYPFQTEEEKKKTAEKIVKDILNAFKMESIYISTLRRMRSTSHLV